MRWLLPVIVLTGSFLMFALEPLTGKIVTPRFGGTAAVWSTCLFFFQFAVLCGYGLTYFLSKLSFRKYIATYAALVLFSVLWMRLPAPDLWKPSGAGAPVWQLLCVLIANVGIPSLLLSSVSGTMQVWYRNMGLGNPYPLYSVSNIGSLGALLAYPLLIEPRLTVSETLWWWGGGFFVLLASLLTCAWVAREKFVLAAPLIATPATGEINGAGTDGENEPNSSNLSTEAATGASAPEPAELITTESSSPATDNVKFESALHSTHSGTSGDTTIAEQQKASSDSKEITAPKIQSSFTSAKRKAKKKNKGSHATVPPATTSNSAPSAASSAAQESQSQAQVKSNADAPSTGHATGALSTNGSLTSTAPSAEESKNQTQPPSPELAQWKQISVWTFLSMLGSLVLLTHTAYITSDIAPVPLLWIAPLAIYLITFILVFASPRFYVPMLFTYLWPILTVIETYIGELHLEARIGINLVNVFLLCMICHGELAWAKPDPSKLALYWLCTSVGGVLAGVLTSVAAPLVFDFYAERQIMFICMALLSVAVIIRRKVYPFGYKPVAYAWVGWSIIALLMLQIGEALRSEEFVHRQRNFYGCAQVLQRTKWQRTLVNGKILHGEQVFSPGWENVPMSYYQIPIAFIDTYLRYRTRGKPVTYAVVGLGVGTMAAYGQPKDQIDFFEIDQKIVDIAKKFFTYLKNCKANLRILMGDARATFQGLPADRQYDLIVVDAFNGDAIPLHLCTEEAIKTYISHLKSDGILLFHVSNRYIDLKPPITSSARKLDLKPLSIDNIESVYLALVRSSSEIDALKKIRQENPKLLEELRVNDVPVTNAKSWTDDFADVASHFRYR